MSVQLILQPQNIQGFSNSISVITSEMVTNGVNFGGVNTATDSITTLSNIFQDILDNHPASIPNIWYRFKSDALASYPTESSGNLSFTQLADSSVFTGIYQQMTNLIVGQVYGATINTPAGTPTNSVFGLTVSNSIGTFNTFIFPNSSTASIQFTATSTNPTIILWSFSDIVETIAVSFISITGANQLFNILNGDGQVICDLYEDEDLPLTLSVDEFKNVAEQVQSYSKAFNLPSTKRNNRIFDAIFEITRADDGIIFNPYRRTQCVLKQDGFILFEGFLRLLDVTDKEGEISYNVNLYSEVIALADYLKDFNFKSLDFTELEHEYNKSEIKRSWNDSGTGITYTNPSTSGFRNAFSTVKYPFVDWTHQLLVADNPSGSGPTHNNTQLPSLETAFRPFINIKYLIDRIFNAPEIPFSYSSEFFNTSDFKKLYMDFNWGSGNAPVVFDTSTVITRNSKQDLTTSFATLDLDSSSPPSEFGYSGGVFTALTDNQSYNITYNMIFKTSVGGETLDVEWVINGVSSFQINIGVSATPSSYHYAGNFSIILTTGDTIFCRAKSTGTTMFLEGGSNSLIVFTTADQTTDDTLLGTLRGELGQWDFLKGLITMFNLVTIPDKDNPNNIKIEPYADIFLNSSDSVQLDWTDKIDISEMKLTPLTDLNKKTIFKFVEDDDDYAFNQYKNSLGGHLYGSYKSNAGDSFTILEGTDEIIAEPFAATFIKPLMSQFADFITPAIYARGGDDTWEGFDNSPRIMYNNGIKDTGSSYYIPPQNGGTSSNTTDFLQFSHLSTVPSVSETTTDYHFETQQMIPGIGTSPVNNLYSMYWQPYFNELYNPNTRIMTIKVNLNPGDINTFKFNDTVYLKNRTFRVNKIDYKPNDLATVEFILIP